MRRRIFSHAGFAPLARRASIRFVLVVSAVFLFFVLGILIQSALLPLLGKKNLQSGGVGGLLIGLVTLIISTEIAHRTYRWAVGILLPPKSPTLPADAAGDRGGESYGGMPVLDYCRLPAKGLTQTPVEATLSYVAGSTVLFLGIFSVSYRHFGGKGFWFFVPVALIGIAMGLRAWNRTRLSVAKIGAGFAGLGLTLMLLAKLRG